MVQSLDDDMLSGFLAEISTGVQQNITDLWRKLKRGPKAHGNLGRFDMLILNTYIVF